MTLHSILQRIDKKLENPDLIGKLVLRITNDAELSRNVSELVRYEGRSACLLDLYSETGKKPYLREAEKQHKNVLDSLTHSEQEELGEIEERVRQYFVFEKILKSRILDREQITEKEIIEYIKRKSADTYCYAWILRNFVSVDETVDELLHIRQSLADISNDLKDYEDDLMQNQPNILVLYFIHTGQLPETKLRAIEYAIKTGVSEKIQRLADTLLGDADKLRVREYPELSKAIAKEHQEIELILAKRTD